MTETVIGTSLDHYQEGLVKVASAIACRMPLVWVITNEERRFCEDLYDLCNSVKSQVHPDNLWVAAQLYTWDGLTGMLPMDSKKQNFFTGNMPEAVIAKYADTHKAANAMKKLREEKVQDGKTAIALCMLDIHLGMTGEHIRMLKNWVYNRSLGKPENDRKYPTIVLVTSEFGVGPTAHKMPAALQTDIPVVFMDLPNRKIIDTIIDVQLEEWKKSLGKHKLVAQEYSAEEKTNLAYALAGLTTVEMNRIIKEIHTRNPKSKLDPALIVEEKKLILQRDGILEPIKPNVTMDDVAGLDLVKKYFQAYKSSFSEDAQKFGVVPPRGVLFVGVPGAGKSLFAKALASFYKMPLLRMDIGRLFNSLVGSSEARTREALKQAEAFGTALLWVDEIEKGLSGTQSSGQSVSGSESLFYKENGTIGYTTFQNLHSIWTDNPNSNFEVLALSNDSLKLEWKKVVKSIRHTTEFDLIKVKTSSGRELRVTQDHSLVTMAEDGNLVEAKAKDLLNKLIPVARNISCEPSVSEVDLSSFNTPQTVHKLGKLKLDRNFGRFLGLWLAEGSINEDAVQIACEEPTIIDFVGEFIKSIFPTKNTKHSWGTWQISSVPLSSWMKQAFTGAASQKEIPDFIFNAPKDFQLGVLEGAISGDGCTSNTGSNSLDLVITSTSTNLLYGYGFLMNQLGMKWTVTLPRKYPSTPDNHQPVGLIRVCCQDIKELVPFCGYKNQAILDYEPGEIQTHRPSDRIPLPKEVISQLVLNRHNPKEEILRTKAYRGRLSAEKTKEYLTLVPENKAKERMNQIVQSDVRWDIVESVEILPKEQYVYDIEVEDNHTFTLSSGIVVHNTDGGTTSRVFGTILTWMQEHKSNIIVIATANDVGALPPELLRRFNEIFFVDLPTEEEREEVFKVLLGHKNRKLAKFDKAKLVANSDKFTGAEIEKSIVEALAQAYADKQEGKCKDMTTEHIVEALNATRPIAVVQPERIQKIRDWAKARARFASSKAWELASGKKAKGTEGAKSGEVDIDSMGDDLLV